MQYIPYNSALLAQETLFLTQKGTFFATNLNLRQNSVCSGLKFSSKSKLFDGCHPCSCATSATLNRATCKLLMRTYVGPLAIQTCIIISNINVPNAFLRKLKCLSFVAIDILSLKTALKQ